MMRRITLALLATTAIGAFACQGASAADMRMPLKAPPPAPPPVQDWSGIYVGVEGGYGWGHQSFNSNVPFGLRSGDTTCTNGGANGNECGNPFEQLQFQNDAANLADPNGSVSGQNQSGGVVGGFFGAQKQWGSWVLGLEGSIDYAHISSNSTNGFTATNSFSSDTDASGRFTSKTISVGNLTSDIDTIGKVNAKVGWAWSPNWMIYGTGGLGFAHEKNTFSFAQRLFQLDCDTDDATECDGRTGFFNPATDGGTFDGFTRVANSSFAGSGGTTMFGWTAGGGIDYKWQLDPGSAVVFGIDYTHYGFGHHTLSLADSGTGRTFSVDATQDIDVIKGRISYFFSIH